MKKYLIIFFLIMSIALCSIILAGCITEDIPEGKDKIVLNEVTHSIFYAPQYAAITLGYFEEENIEIELVNGGGADKSMIALITGEADIGLMGPEAAIYSYLEGNDDYPVVFGQLTKRDGSFLVGRNPDDDFDWSGLENTTIIMGRKGGVPAMTLQYILNQHGYYDGVNITMDYSVSFNMLAPAFIEGKGDYVPLFEPTATAVARDGLGYIVTSIGKDSGEVPYTAYMAKKSTFENDPDLLERFLRAIKKGVDFIMTASDEEIVNALKPHFDDTSAEEIIWAMNSYKANDTWMKTPSMTEESFNRLQDIIENAGELSRRAPFAIVVDNSIADKIR